MASLAETVHDDHAFFVNERARLGLGRGRSAGGIVLIAFKVMVWILFMRGVTRA